MNNEALLQLLESQISVNGRYGKLQRINTSPGGGGEFSLVLTAYDSVTGKVVVLKFDHPTLPWEYRHECFKREAAVLAKFKGELNILQLVDGISSFIYQISLPTGGSVPLPFRFIALERARFSLFEYINVPPKKHSPLRSLIYFREICKGVQRLHSAKCCHRDLRPQNCLVMNGSYAVIGDLGTAKILLDGGTVPSPTTPYSEPVGHIMYTAPELLCGLDSDTDIAFAADMYSLGAILFELFARTNLSGYLYSVQEIHDKMIRPFHQVTEENRKQIFDQSIGALEAAVPLPNIGDVAPDGAVPESVKLRLNALYKGLACLDYRKRMRKFDWVFLQLEIMSRILTAELRRTRRAQFKARMKVAT